MSRETEAQLLLGEWACLGILYEGPSHGFAIAARLKPTGDIGRVWSLSRPLTYRSLEQLSGHGYVETVGNRTILAATRSGRAQLRKWLRSPVVHLRDIRSELLLKLVIADRCGIDVTDMLVEQRDHIEQLSAALTEQVDDSAGDVVAVWRREQSRAALRFLDQIMEPRQEATG